MGRAVALTFKLPAVEQVVAVMSRSDRHALVMKSTVPVGTGEAIKRVFAGLGSSASDTSRAPSF